MTPDQLVPALRSFTKRVPLIIGATIIDFALDNWDKQGFQAGSFQPWEKTVEPKPGRSILVGKQSGRLRRSIRELRTSQSKVEVGSSLDYAKIHNDGGVIRVPVTDRSRRFFWAQYYRTNDPRWRGMALSKKSAFMIRIPKRQFIGQSPVLDRMVKEALEKELKTIFN
jgi:phage gpG-like protein